jgi:hypothetical protein
MKSFLLFICLLLAPIVSNAVVTTGDPLLRSFGRFYAKSQKSKALYSCFTVPFINDLVGYFKNYPIDCLVLVRGSSLPFKVFFWQTLTEFYLTAFGSYFDLAHYKEMMYKSIRNCIQEKFLTCFDIKDTKEREFQAIRLMIKMALEIPIKDCQSRSKMVATWHFLLKNLEYDYQKKIICLYSFFNLFSKVLKLDGESKCPEELYILLVTYLSIIILGCDCEFIIESHFYHKPTLILLILKLQRHPSFVINFKVGEFGIEHVKYYLKMMKRDLATFVDEIIKDYSKEAKYYRALSRTNINTENLTKMDRWLIPALLETKKIQRRIK